jgi:hypothetical protein
MSPPIPSNTQVEAFIQKVQMNLDFGHYDFIDEHISLFMIDPQQFSPVYIMSFLETAYSKRFMLKEYNMVLEYAKTIFPADELTKFS